MNLEQLKSINLDNLTLDERVKVQELIKELTIRKIEYWLLDFKPLEHQETVINAVAETKENTNLPVYKFLLFQWWNWSWKSVTGVYIAILKALGKDVHKYWLPYIWEAKQIIVVSKTGSSIKQNLMPYFIEECTDKHPTKIPKEMIKGKPEIDKWILKKITLKNGCVIQFVTNDMGFERLEGSNPDFILADEFPDNSVFYTLLRWTRWKTTQFLITATPNAWIKNAAYDYFYEQEDEKVKDMSFTIRVDSRKNTYADHTWLEGLPENIKKAKAEWLFVPASGLVYPEFRNDEHIIPFFNPKTLWSDTKFYWAVDFGFVHPMAFLFIAVDADNHVYVFDMIYKSNMLIKELADRIQEKVLAYWISFDYIVADSAGRLEREELKAYWFPTISADKKSIGENEHSNRSTWVNRINTLLKEGFIYISDKCKDLANEFNTHRFLDNWKDDVLKEGDDALDARRKHYVTLYSTTLKMMRVESLKKLKINLPELKRNLQDINNKLHLLIGYNL